jgi:hypothetical protein
MNLSSVLSVKQTVYQGRNSALHLEYMLFPNVQKTTLLWDVSPYILVDVYLHVRVAY